MKKIYLLTIMSFIVVLSACSKQENNTDTGLIKQPTVAQTEKTTEEVTKLDLENQNDVIVETIGKTELYLEESKQEVGIVETEENGGFVGIAENNQIVSGLSISNITEGITLNEDQSITLDGILESWVSDDTMQQSYLEHRIYNNSLFDNISSDDKESIIEDITSKYPHEVNPEYERDFSDEESGISDKTFETLSREEALKNAETSVFE